MRKLNIIVAVWAAGMSWAGPVLAQEMCGGLQGLQCAERQYCDFAGAQCGAADMTGVCRAKPDVCTEHYAPVCGCDGQTYGNACEAAMAEVSVAEEGACGESAQPWEQPAEPEMP